MKKRIFFFVILLTTMFSTESFAFLRFALVGDVAKPTMIASGPAEYAPNGLGYGAGALLTLMSLQIGAIYKIQKIENTQFSGTTAFNTTYERREVEVPILLRKSFLHVFSIGAGGYFAKVLDASGSFTTNKSTTPRPADAGDLKKADFGATGSIALEIPMGIAKHLLIDARYNYGLAKIKTREGEGLIGLEFGI